MHDPEAQCGARRAEGGDGRRRIAARGQMLGSVLEGKYRIDHLIGHGAMAAVYEAEPIGGGAPVAIKVLHLKHAHKRDAMKRLEHEARVVRILDHPNICRIWDAGRLADGSPYLVMERLHGETLAQRLVRDGRVGLYDLLTIARQVLGAIELAHRHGVVHRDLKPDNIFIESNSVSREMGVSAKILDFGISKASDIEDTAAHLTKTGMVMGTPYYMAPEQARGDELLDGRVDLWALGVVLYEGLTGVRPFVAENYNALLVEVLTARHRPMQHHVPGISRAVSDIIDRALSKRREDRFASAREFADALEGVMGSDAAEMVTMPMQPDPDAGSDPQDLEGCSPPMQDTTEGPTIVFRRVTPLPLAEDTSAGPSPVAAVAHEGEDTEDTVVDPPDPLGVGFGGPSRE